MAKILIVDDEPRIRELDPRASAIFRVYLRGSRGTALRAGTAVRRPGLIVVILDLCDGLT